MDGIQLKRIQEILLKAFPRETELARMVRFGLNKNLAAITGGPTLQDRVFQLLLWAESCGSIPKLLIAATNENPTNLELRSLVLWLHDQSQNVTLPSNDIDPYGVSLSAKELVSILEMRAERLLTTIKSAYLFSFDQFNNDGIQYVKVTELTDRFSSLHEKHIQAIKSGHLIEAHEIAGEIYSVLYELSHELHIEIGERALVRGFKVSIVYGPPEFISIYNPHIIVDNIIRVIKSTARKIR